jgi:putative RNA 2'-phosphotransferase
LTPAQLRLSKRLARVLRHDPRSAGLSLDAHGWVSVTDLLAALHITRSELDVAVAGDGKTRFAVAVGEDGVHRIRASQGHSRGVEVDLGLPRATPPELLFHGTPRANLASITANGLRPGSRHHVHLSVDVPTAVAVGRRRSSDVVVFVVRAGELAAAGHPFHLSANGVWLTPDVPPDAVSPQS